MNDANDERVGEIEGGARGVDDDPLDERTVRLEEEAHGNDDDEDDEDENITYNSSFFQIFYTFFYLLHLTTPQTRVSMMTHKFRHPRRSERGDPLSKPPCICTSHRMR